MNETKGECSHSFCKLGKHTPAIHHSRYHVSETSEYWYSGWYIHHLGASFSTCECLRASVCFTWFSLLTAANCAGGQIDAKQIRISCKDLNELCMLFKVCKQRDYWWVLTSFTSVELGNSVSKNVWAIHDPHTMKSMCNSEAAVSWELGVSGLKRLPPRSYTYFS